MVRSTSVVPFRVSQDLPYGTMKDDEMLNLDIGCLQDDGVIFVWVTGEPTAPPPPPRAAHTPHRAPAHACTCRSTHVCMQPLGGRAALCHTQCA